MQYRRFRDNYIFSMTPVTAEKMEIFIQKFIGESLKTLSEILPDADAIALKGEFEGAADETALDTWYAARLAAVSGAV